MAAGKASQTTPVQITNVFLLYMCCTIQSCCVILLVYTIVGSVWHNYGWRKYDHVSHYRFFIGWLPVSSVILHHSLVAVYMQYRRVLLNLQVIFGWHNSYLTRTPASFVNISWYNLSFCKYFRSKATNWWNNLPVLLISSSATKFSHRLYYLLIIHLIVCIILLCGLF